MDALNTSQRVFPTVATRTRISVDLQSTNPVRQMALFPDIRKASLVFGEAATAYGPIINDIEPYLAREKYRFEDLEIFAAKSGDPEAGAAYANRVYWTETLQRAHLASVATIVRTCRWVDVAVREYEKRNIFGWASAARSLIEAGGDTGHSLGSVPLTLADNRTKIEACLAGESTYLYTSTELEDALIHFTHARKISKGEIVAESHRARSSAEYVRYVASMKVGDAQTLYAHLCEIVHPAALSVAMTFAPSDGDYVVDLKLEEAMLLHDVRRWKDTLGGCLMASLNPALLTLRVLHAFNLFVKIPPLRKVNFQRIPAWAHIGKSLR